MTFTLAARCPETGQFGIVIASSSPAVAARCAHARAGVGVVATQNVTDPALGPRLLDLLDQGLTAQQALAGVTAATPDIGWRQVLVVDRAGGTAAFTGDRALGVHGQVQDDGVVAGGNLLAGPGVPAAMIAAYRAATGPFGDRLLAGLTGGLAAGGEAGPVHSAGMKIADRLTWPLVDLRVDWAETDPVTLLHKAWQVYGPQAQDYVRRAQSPGAAPGYGVPGDARRVDE
ncbi:MAG: DUF1028 domain-containing protein [Rhodobacter sp.]|nr:DUF1028 domain-containing protein [Rhodobacter sp.]